MADVFADTANALAILLGTTGEIAGYLLGFITIIVLLVGFILIFGTDVMQGNAALVIVGAPIAFIALIGWWPTWTILFIVAMIFAAWAFQRGGA